MRARRSCLSVPARPSRKLEKASEISADEVVVDLEDSVPVELKDEARAAVAEALAGARWAAATVSVRVNGVGTPWFEDDVRAIAAAGDRLDSLILPKVESPDDLGQVEELLASIGTQSSSAEAPPIGLQALIESARGLRDVNQIATASPRLEALILGPADMSVSLGFPSPDDGERWTFVRGGVVVAARAAGLQAIDGPFLRISDLDGLRESAARARDLGFDGKWALHPDQIGPLDEAFSPSAGEVARARSILAALREAPDRGAVMLDGEMIDEASRKRAEGLLARAGAAEGATAR
jgi:citrate lyase subunit beta / citryl-CoA lyase